MSGNRFCGSCDQIYAADLAKTLFMVPGSLSQHDQRLRGHGKFSVPWLTTIGDQQWVIEAG